MQNESRNENSQITMQSEMNDKRLRYFIGDVRDFGSINNAMKGVDYVFHAAALKQVPSCEFFPEQAINTNLIGSLNVIDVAVTNKVKKVVGLSTDKAEMPKSFSSNILLKRNAD